MLIVSVVAELERSLIVEGVGAGVRLAKLEGRHIGRRPLDLDREAILRDHRLGQSLGTIAREQSISRATVHRVVHKPAPNPQKYFA